MSSDYHHGDLKKALVINGLKLFNEQGVDGLTMRKVAKACNVSHTAPYKHFKNKEDLLHTIGRFVVDEFANTLQSVVNEIPNDPTTQIVEIGKRYVIFMVKNPDYLKYLFLNTQGFNIKFKNSILETNDDPLFEIFHQSASRHLTALGIPLELHAENIIAMWSMVHGISFLLVNNTMTVEGDIGDFVESLLVKKLKFDLL